MIESKKEKQVYLNAASGPVNVTIKIVSYWDKYLVDTLIMRSKQLSVIKEEQLSVINRLIYAS